MYLMKQSCFNQFSTMTSINTEGTNIVWSVKIWYVRVGLQFNQLMKGGSLTWATHSTVTKKKKSDGVPQRQLHLVSRPPIIWIIWTSDIT